MPHSGDTAEFESFSVCSIGRTIVDDAIRAAEQRRDEAREIIAREKNKVRDAQSLIERMEDRVSELDAWIAKWYELTGAKPPTTIAHAHVPSPPPRKRPINPDREFVADQAIEIIRAHGAPMLRADLFKALAQRDIVILGKDPEMVLSTMLWREQERIVRLPQHGYWPADTPYPEAFYLVGDMLDAAAREPEGGVEAEEA
jgi:hypothetical protein